MKREFSLTLDGTVYKIAVDGNSILVNGQPFVAGFEGERVLINAIPYDVRLEGDQVTVGGIRYSLAVDGLAQARGAQKGPAAAAGAGAVTAVMPGKIIRMLVAEGDEIAEGQVLCILEAMKMENELKAPKAGRVKALYAQPGQNVEKGAVLAEIE
ncbi:MAG TPA: acetyl-CoA carboxylase biotin carboxyl carrier protein subunit [Anaerolineae bacterium]|nr:acetyl-CoA carboxylase biotin carboxyl carrier protein subunit [Anaerolineae bacterium]